MDFQAGIHKPLRQHQGDDNLGNEPDDPQYQGVYSVFDHIRFQQFDIIGHSDKIGTDLLKTRTIVLKKAITDRVYHRNKGKDKKA